MLILRGAVDTVHFMCFTKRCSPWGK